MRHPAARWSVLVVAIAAAAALCYRATMLERHALDLRRIVLASTSEARSLHSALSDARRALAAMASPGQAAMSWSRQANAAIQAARERLAALAGTPGSTALSASAERLDRLTEAEGRLREYAVGGRTLMASDVAFGEALPHIDALDGQVADALGQINAAADRDMAVARDQQVLFLAGALGALGLAALLLTPYPRVKVVPAVISPAAATDPHDVALDLHPVAPRPILRTDPAPGPAARLDPPAVAASRLDLPPVAAVCSELARLSNGAALASILERVGPAIGAKGVVVWLADAERTTLHAVASWGYDPRVVERFPSVPVADDNPTSRAFASSAPAVPHGRATQAASAALPIVGPAGAAGVLSVELTARGEASADAVAAAGIVAAQLATLLEPLPRVEPSASGTVSAQS